MQFTEKCREKVREHGMEIKSQEADHLPEEDEKVKGGADRRGKRRTEKAKKEMK